MLDNRYWIFVDVGKTTRKTTKNLKVLEQWLEPSEILICSEVYEFCPITCGTKLQT